VKRTIARVIRRTRDYVASLDRELDGKPQPPSGTSGDQWTSVHPWLNSIFAELLQDKFAAQRAWYTWGVLQGARLAKVLGIDHVSVIEFGVAGGNGLVSLERIAEKVGGVFGVTIDAYGFDSGGGLPKPQDYRDCPNLFSPGHYPMDEEKLRKRLHSARLVLGLVEDTVSEFIASRPAPVAFISFDLDYYSSTMQAFKLLEAAPALLLPRVYCYFDDIMGFTYSDYNGERLAIMEFNASHGSRKISPIYGLKYFLSAPHAQSDWAEMFYMVHIFDHELYEREDGSAEGAVGGPTDLQDDKNG
jgi:hypothetical protein